MSFFSGCCALMLAQGYSQQAINSENTKLFWILAAIAFAFVVIAIAVVVLVVEVLKTRTKILGIVEDLHGRSLPIIDQSTHLLNDITPKVKDITGNVQHISAVARNKVEEFEPTLTAANRTVKDANEKTHEQIVRVNELITTVLNSTNEIVDKVDQGIKAPFREASGIWTGIKAGYETLRTGRRPASGARPGYSAGRPGTSTPGHAGHTPGAEPASAYAGPYRHSAPPAHAETPATAAAEAAAAAFARAEHRQEL